MRGLWALAAVVCLMVHLAYADVYIQHPRGSNNRLDGQNRARANANRLFDSQNNNRGGYNVGNIYYYAGSDVVIEWTNQHSCGHPNNDCEIVLQYSCDDRIRDGTSTTTIPTNQLQCLNFDCDTDPEYGRHESWHFWKNECVFRSRNKGLFTANQNLRGDGAVYTRQNPDGTRRGYECPEERDYYPYWHPTMWRDIAVLTNDPQRCAAYKRHSQNVEDRWVCKPPHPDWVELRNSQNGFIPIVKEDCEALEYTHPTTGQVHNGTWTRVPSWGIAPPDCLQNPWSRDNHHGNTAHERGYPPMYNWTVPDSLIHKQCVLRLRYNISTGDYPGFESDASVQVSPLADYNYSSEHSNPNPNNDPARIPIWKTYGLPYSSVADSFDRSKNGNQATLTNSREYVLKNNPQVDIFGSLLTNKEVKLQLAINTAQLGRTFQDRTHRFEVKRRPEGVSRSDTIHNLQVRGKRGNIVQVYPAVEYDFHPNKLHVGTGDLVHIQWTGSDRNPNNNDGQGREGTDRSNIVSLRPPQYMEDGISDNPTSASTHGHLGNSYFDPVVTWELPSARFTAAEKSMVWDAIASQSSYTTPWTQSEVLATSLRHSGHDDPQGEYVANMPFLGLNGRDIANLAQTNPGHVGGETSELDDAGTYFDLGLRRITMTGTYNYMCTRNNNFSNRSQKGKIVVINGRTLTVPLGWPGGSWQVDKTDNIWVTVPQGAFSEATYMSVGTMHEDDAPADIDLDPGQSVVSKMVVVDLQGEPSQPLEIRIGYTERWFSTDDVYYAPSAGAEFKRMFTTSKVSDGSASLMVSQSGVYMVVAQENWPLLIGVIFGVVLFFGTLVMMSTFCYKRRRQGYSYGQNCTYICTRFKTCCGKCGDLEEEGEPLLAGEEGRESS